MIQPDLYYDSVHIIPYEELWKKNIRGLIFDLDNTLAPYDRKDPPARTVALLRRLERMGFKICLVTNNTKGRLQTFNKNLGLDGISGAVKPLTRGINAAMAKMKTKNTQTAIIGDQLLSDIWGGKNAKILTILVKPITEKDFFLVKIKRKIERRLLRDYFKKLGVKW